MPLRIGKCRGMEGKEKGGGAAYFRRSGVHDVSFQHVIIESSFRHFLGPCLAFNLGVIAFHSFYSFFRSPLHSFFRSARPSNSHPTAIPDLAQQCHRLYVSI